MFQKLDSFLPKIKKANEDLDDEIAKGNSNKYKIDSLESDITCKDKPEINDDANKTENCVDSETPTIEFVSLTNIVDALSPYKQLCCFIISTIYIILLSLLW